MESHAVQLHLSRDVNCTFVQQSIHAVYATCLLVTSRGLGYQTYCCGMCLCSSRPCVIAQFCPIMPVTHLCSPHHTSIVLLTPYQEEGWLWYHRRQREGERERERESHIHITVTNFYYRMFFIIFHFITRYC
jgi:hypothetical protein